MSKIQFGQDMQSAKWDPVSNVWAITTKAASFSCKFVVFATGPMHVPKFPDIPGLGAFPGHVFHSCEWNHSVDLKGKKVAVIGSGASAIQV